MWSLEPDDNAMSGFNEMSLGPDLLHAMVAAGGDAVVIHTGDPIHRDCVQRPSFRH